MTPESSGKTILIVDDDRSIRRSLHAALDDEGYSVDEADNGLEALRRLRRGPRPNVILLDLMMPVMDGYTFSSEMGGEPDLADIPVIVVTAGGNCAEVRRRLTVMGCLHKPLDLDRLLDTIERVQQQYSAATPGK
jgi:two-component system, chemotaxis family, chemotaxis protein CheY